MNKDDFVVINGRLDDSDLTEEIVWRRADEGERVMSIHSTTYKAYISERRLRKIIDKLKKTPGIKVTYDAFENKDREYYNQLDQLHEMYDDTDITVLNPRRRR